MQCLRRRIDFRRCLAFLLPPLLLMLYQLLFSEYTSLYPDARLYLSIADNFLHTGHFIQTDRAGVEIVVPFAYPLYIHVTKKEREKLAPQVLKLVEELSTLES